MPYQITTTVTVEQAFGITEPTSENDIENIGEHEVTFVADNLEPVHVHSRALAALNNRLHFDAPFEYSYEVHFPTGANVKPVEESH